jgi:chemotaxis protein methyltransferase CheR
MGAVALLDDLTPADLERLATVLRERSGLAFGEARWPFLRNRAREVMVRARFVSIRRWLEELAASAERRGALYCDLEEALQVHETSFFRYEEHYRALRDHVLPALVRSGGPRVRICSVGCSTGEEAYSIAMAVRESGLRGVAGKVDIVGLDVSRHALSLAVAGTYPASRLESVPPDYRARYFLSTGDRCTVVPALRQMIRFRHHDVRRGFYIGKFDVIVCCNVLLDFTPAVKQQVLSQLADSLAEGGYLFLGHAEGITPPEASFATRGLPAPFMHQRLGRLPTAITLA